MIVKISGNKKMIVAGIAAMPRMNAIPCDPKAEMSHQSIPIVAMQSCAVNRLSPNLA
jgi:hypothetical protein